MGTNTFIKKKKPLDIGHNGHNHNHNHNHHHHHHHMNNNEWRKKKPIMGLINKDDTQNNKNYQELKGLLNRISPNNHLTILDEINKTIQNYQDPEEHNQYLFMFLNDMLKKARMEPNFCLYYVKIIIELEDKEIIDKFINDLKEKYKQTISALKISFEDDANTNTNVNDNVNANDNTNNLTENGENYDEFCQSLKNKNYQKGYSQFIGELFNFNKININEFISYCVIIIDNILCNIKNSDNPELFDDDKKKCIKAIEENVMYISSLLEITLKNVLNNVQQTTGNSNGNNNNEQVLNLFKNISTLSENKVIPNKTRYLLADLYDSYNKLNRSIKKNKK
jgi:hypothetical protein